MKRLSFIISMLLLAFAANAQTYNVHMKNGEVVKHNSSSVDNVNFSVSVPTYNVHMKNGEVVKYSSSMVDSIGFYATNIPAGAEAIDLGLPSGKLWANMNVGASSPEEYGDYFAWGETTPKSTYNWDSYKWCNGSYRTLTKYCNNSSYGYNGFIDDKTVLDAEDDAATANWGGDWCMPTIADFKELKNNTTKEWTRQNGVLGYKFTSKTNGNSIFLPAAGGRIDGKLISEGSYGNYWSSSLREGAPFDALYLCFVSGYVNTNNNYRYNGYSVRPVYMAESSNTVATDIRDVKTHDGSFNLQHEQVSFSGYAANEPVMLFTVDGRQLQSYRVGADGQLTISLGQLPAGIYIIKTSHQSIKITKK